MDHGPEERSLNWLDSATLKRLCRQSQELLQRAQARAAHWCSHVEGLREEGKPINLNTSFKSMVAYMDYVSSQCGRFHNSAREKAALNHVCRYHQNQLDPMSSSWVRQKKSTSHDPRESYQVTKTGPGPSRFDLESSRLGPGLSRFDPGSSRFDPGSSRFDPESSRLGPGPSRFDPGSSRFDPGSSRFGQGSSSSKSVTRTSSVDITIEVSPGTYAVTVGSPNVTTTHMIEVDSGQIIDLSFPL
ncbi:A-kinase-interacting protein 1 isoform X2 [Notamacropus eugenii]